MSQPEKPVVNHSPKVLVLGGTMDARKIAEVVAGQGMQVIYSLAGVTASPTSPPVPVRTGGFGGAVGLQQFLEQQAVEAVIDATHPYAQKISVNALQAAAACAIPLFRLERPLWTPAPGATWINVDSIEAAANLLPQGARVFVTTGRKNLWPFVTKHGLSGVVRTIEPPGIDLPAGWRIMLARPPFALADEIRALTEASATHLVTKNAGGEEGKAKLDAAHQLGVQVVMIDRPKKTGGTVVNDIAAFANFRDML